MSEITPDKFTEVKQFIEKEFRVPTSLSEDYARIAVFLSNTNEFQKSLARVSSWIEEIWWQIWDMPGCENIFERLIGCTANARGWHVTSHIVLAGFTNPELFKSFVRDRLFWRDAVGSLHGEFSHSLQWLAISDHLGDRTPYLYQKSVDYESTKKFYKGSKDMDKINLWDFLVDCFNFGGTPDWQNNIITSTCRSPAQLNKLIHTAFGDMWIAKALIDRNESAKLPPPTDPENAIDLAEVNKQALLSGGTSSNPDVKGFKEVTNPNQKGKVFKKDDAFVDAFNKPIKIDNYSIKPLRDLNVIAIDTNINKSERQNAVDKAKLELERSINMANSATKPKDQTSAQFWGSLTKKN